MAKTTASSPPGGSSAMLNIISELVWAMTPEEFARFRKAIQPTLDRVPTDRLGKTAETAR